MAQTIEGKKGFYGWKNVILLFVICVLTAGLVYYGFSAIFPAMIKAMNWNRGTASIAPTISVLLEGLIAPLVAVSIKKLGGKKTISWGLALTCVGLLLLGTVTTRIWQWIVLWGIVCGVAFAFCSLFPVQTMVIYWFNVKRATAMGIVLTGAAVGGFVAQPFYTWLIRVSGSWRFGWLNGAFFVFIALVCSLFLVNKPEEIGQYPDGLSPDEVGAAENQAGGGARTYRTERTWNVKQVFRNPVIYFITMIHVGEWLPLSLLTSHGILHFMDTGLKQMEAASILSLVFLGSGIGRFPAGWLGDRIEPRWILTVTFGIILALYLVIWKSTNLNILMISGAIFGFSNACQFIMVPIIIGNYYGPEVFPDINAIIVPIFILFAAAVPVGAGYIFEKYGSYDAAFVIMIIVLTVSLILSFLLTPPKRAE